LAVEEHFYLFAPLLFVFLSWRASLIGVIVLAVFCAIVRWTEVHSNLFTTFVEFRTENRLDGLMYGAVLAHLLHHVEWRSTIKRYLTLPIILVVTIATLLVLLEFSSMPIRRTVLAIALPLLIAHTVLHPQDWIGKLLEYRIMRWLGRMSYSIYIWQMLFFVQGVRDMPILQSFPIAIVATMVCAYVSYQWIEKPMIALGHKISKRLSQPQ
jgi:peptidoglycan/LPS O-acetylase OafA/YrhL